MGASVLIVDDHAGFRLSARRILEVDGYEIVGEAAGGRSATQAVRPLAPAILLPDVNLPDLDGFEVARAIANEPGAPAIVLTSSHDREDFGDSLPSSRAAGFVPKDELCGAAVAALVA